MLNLVSKRHAMPKFGADHEPKCFFGGLAGPEEFTDLTDHLLLQVCIRSGCCSSQKKLRSRAFSPSSHGNEKFSEKFPPF